MSGEKPCFEETKRKEKVMREKELIFCVFALQNRFGKPIRDALSRNKNKNKNGARCIMQPQQYF